MLEEVPLVERERELDVLNSLFREAKQGRGLAVAISGEAGIGKSRLVREFARRHAGADVCFIEARCYRDVGALPYGPWTTVLKELAEIEVSPQVPNMQTFAPHIFRVLTSLSTSTEAPVSYTHLTLPTNREV